MGSNDLISRSETIEILEDLNAAGFYEYNEHSRELYEEMKHSLKGMQPAMRWFLVSEKLPDDGDRVYITTPDGRVCAGTYHADRDFVWQAYRPRRLNDIKAWMPLYCPEPYKGDTV